MTIKFGKSGYTPFELKSPTHFVEGESLSFKLALREQETMSGPKLKEFKEPLIEKIKVDLHSAILEAEPYYRIDSSDEN